MAPEYEKERLRARLELFARISHIINDDVGEPVGRRWSAVVLRSRGHATARPSFSYFAANAAHFGTSFSVYTPVECTSGVPVADLTPAAVIA